MKYFFLTLPKTTKCEFSNFNIGTVNAHVHEMGEEIKS